MISPKPNFSALSLAQLKRYVLDHRDDSEAWEEYASRKRPHAIYFDANIPVSEIEIRLKAIFQQKTNH